MSDTGRIFTAAKIAEYAQEALDNWAWDVEEDNGQSPAQVEAMKEALTLTADEAKDLWGEELDLDSAFADIWEMLYEFAISTAATVN